MRKGVIAAGVIALITVAGPAWACGGLIGANGTVNLGTTTTLAAYVGGIEHYITGFSFAGAGGEFGSIVPLPDVPTKVEKAGDWTLQRLQIEVQPPELRFAVAEAGTAALTSADVILEAEVDSLDITVLRGGSRAVGVWAADHGFRLPPDTPEVLDFYAARSPIFMAVRFNAERAAAQGLAEGQATPVHVTIPTDAPWVPLRILGLGKQASEPVQADVFLLNERRPALLPLDRGLTVERSERASASLLTDLRSDDRMGWLPDQGLWFSYLRLDAPAGDLTYDLAVDPSGGGDPSEIDAGLAASELPVPVGNMAPWWALAAALGILAVAMLGERRANA
jgi:hypothetical protein